VLCCLRRLAKGKGLLTLFLRKPKENAKAILKTYELFIYGNGSFCKKVIKVAISEHWL
jgi:hypothetical protein